MRSKKKDVLSRFEVLASSGYWESLYSSHKVNSYNYITRRKEIVNLISHLDYCSVVDLGCGTGDYAEYFLKKGEEYLGVDNSREMIMRAQKRFPGALFQVDDVENLSLLSEKYDLALAVGLIEYFAKPGKLVKEIRSILKKEGYFLVQAPHLLCLHRIVLHLFYPLINLQEKLTKQRFIASALYTESSLRALIEPYGFAHCATHYCNYCPMPWPFSRFSPKLCQGISERITKAQNRQKYKYLATNVIILFQKV